jgi:hypothetical protein
VERLLKTLSIYSYAGGGALTLDMYIFQTLLNEMVEHPVLALKKKDF